ncbi:MAG: pyridoxamine 5'-phosphate oxidase family protein [Candidatus Methanoplasma sp.]|nr:pyridoxamine 5'-phosphate oxidase family protein [Candidatus Methanoplasma sp.]
MEEIADILRRADAVRLGLRGDEHPYVVPMSFGMEATGGRIAIYVHGAKEGLKSDLIARDPRVCIEADIFHGNIETAGGGRRGVSTVYESVIGFGECERVHGAEAARGLGLILAHSGFEGFDYDRGAAESAAVWKISLDRVSGKRRPPEEQGGRLSEARERA